MSRILRAPAGTSRAIRRRMAQLSDEVGKVTKADAAFFARRLDRTYRLRLMSRAELEQLAMVSEVDVTPKPGKRWFVIVKKVSSLGRMRVFATLDDSIDTDICDAWCRALFDATPGNSDYGRQIEAGIRHVLRGAE